MATSSLFYWGSQLLSFHSRGEGSPFPASRQPCWLQPALLPWGLSSPVTVEEVEVAEVQAAMAWVGCDLELPPQRVGSEWVGQSGCGLVGLLSGPACRKADAEHIWEFLHSDCLQAPLEWGREGGMIPPCGIHPFSCSPINTQ